MVIHKFEIITATSGENIFYFPTFLNLGSQYEIHNSKSNTDANRATGWAFSIQGNIESKESVSKVIFPEICWCLVEQLSALKFHRNSYRGIADDLLCRLVWCWSTHKFKRPNWERSEMWLRNNLDGHPAIHMDTHTSKTRWPSSHPYISSHPYMAIHL